MKNNNTTNMDTHVTIFTIREKFPTNDASYLSLKTMLNQKQIPYFEYTSSKGQPIILWFKKVYWSKRNNKKNTTIKWATHMLQTQYSFCWSYKDINDDIQDLSTAELIEIYNLKESL